LAAGSLGLRTR
jgi:tetratricopeptide (TPR) repeat protein